MKRFIFSLMVGFALSIATLPAMPQADYTPPEVTQTSVQSYKMTTDFDFVKVEFAVADIVFIEKICVEKQVLEINNIAFINTAAENSDIGYIDQFRLCGTFDKYNNTVCRYSKRYNITTYYKHSTPFIYQQT
jgi:hypothetical protein